MGKPSDNPINIPSLISPPPIHLPLETKNCNLVATGWSDVRINVTEKFDMLVSGGGNVYYMGNPTIQRKIFAGTGFIVKRKAGNISEIE